MKVRIIHNESVRKKLGNDHYSKLAAKHVGRTYTIGKHFSNQVLYREHGDGPLCVMNSITFNATWNIPLDMVAPIRYSNPLKKETNIK